jgi:hypothetical protein
MFAPSAINAQTRPGFAPDVFFDRPESFPASCPSLPVMPAVPGSAKVNRMVYRKNVGPKERWARMAGGALIVACSLTQLGLTPLGIALALVGLVTACSGVLGFCPACAMAGRRPLEDRP